MQAYTLFSHLGGIDDFYVQEAENATASMFNRVRRSKAMKYGAYGLALSVGVAMAIWKASSKKAA